MKKIFLILIPITCVAIFGACTSHKMGGGISSSSAKVLDSWPDIDSKLIKLNALSDIEAERKAVEILWNAMLERSYQESQVLNPSDTIIIYLTGDLFDEKHLGLIFALPILATRNEGNDDQLRFLKEYIEKLILYYVGIDPVKGETPARRDNLELLKLWLAQLNDCMRFDENFLVGMFKFLGDRHLDFYNQKEETLFHYQLGISAYNKALERTRDERSKLILAGDIAHGCSRFRGNDQKRLIKEYRKGLIRASQALSLYNKIGCEERNLSFENWQSCGTALTAIQKAYGNNLIGLLYNSFLEKRYRDIVELRIYTDVDFALSTPSDTYLLIAGAACKIYRLEGLAPEYLKVCLEYGKRAYKTALLLLKEKPDTYKPEFCRAFNAYWNYLMMDGDKNQADTLEKLHGHLCPSGKK